MARSPPPVGPMTLFTAVLLPKRSSPRTTGTRRAGARRLTLAWALIGLITLAGLALRLAAARGDLWLDELWSLDLVSHITSPDQVFWAISHDNNHFLTSLWMYAVGQDASPRVYRAPAVALGTLSILAAARIGWRSNAASAVAAALLAACSYPFVDYGSEARGYAGLILASLLAIDLTMSVLDAMEAGPDRTASRRQVWLLAGVIALGTCAHLTMVVEAALLGLAAIGRLKLAGRSMREAIDGAVGMFSPSVLLLLPIAAAIGIGIVRQGEFTVGGQVPFAPERWLAGFGGLLGTMLGLPGVVATWAGPLVAGALVAAGLAARSIDRRWLPLALASLVLWPAALFVGRLPNTEHPRYFLAAGLILLILLAEVVGRLWERRGFPRVASVALVGLVSLGQVPPVLALLCDGRGAPGEAVALMGREGPTTFVAQPGLNIEPIVASFATRQGVAIGPAGRNDGCVNPAEWLITDGKGALIPQLTQAGPASCRTDYRIARLFRSAPWSGQAWAVYRRVK